MSYSNFKDPLGLLKRMLLSSNQVAYSVLWRELFSKILAPLDFLLKGYENRNLKKSKDDSQQPIVLVLGGSRSGTTLLYQTLAHYLPFSFVDNFISAFHRSPISAYKLFHKFIPKSKKSFRSYYGSTEGLGGPNDAFSIWNRWLGEDRNHIPKDIDSKSKLEMRNFFNTWLNVAKKPFLNKNNRNSLCAPMFNSIFKNIFFVEIYRDPVFVAQSLILSRREVQGSNEIGWGLLSKDSEDTEDSLGYIDDICHQVYQVNNVLSEGRKKIDSKKYIRVSFENFCNNPGDIVQKVAIGTIHRKIKSEDLESLRFSTTPNKQRLTDKEFNRIRSCFEKLHSDDKI